MNLYEIGLNYIELNEMVELAGDENIPTAVTEFMEEIDGDFEEKVINSIYVIKNKEANVVALKDEEKRLANKRKRLEKEIDSMKNWIFENMQAIEKKEIKHDLFDVKIRKNPPKAEIIKEDLIPDEFVKVEEIKKINKRELLVRLKEGEIIPGAELTQGERLDIR